MHFKVKIFASSPIFLSLHQTDPASPRRALPGLSKSSPPRISRNYHRRPRLDVATISPPRISAAVIIPTLNIDHPRDAHWPARMKSYRYPIWSVPWTVVIRGRVFWLVNEIKTCEENLIVIVSVMGVLLSSHDQCFLTNSWSTDMKKDRSSVSIFKSMYITAMFELSSFHRRIRSIRDQWRSTLQQFRCSGVFKMDFV